MLSDFQWVSTLEDTSRREVTVRLEHCFISLALFLQKTQLLVVCLTVSVYLCFLSVTFYPPTASDIGEEWLPPLAGCIVLHLPSLVLLALAPSACIFIIFPSWTILHFLMLVNLFLLFSGSWLINSTADSFFLILEMEKVRIVIVSEIIATVTKLFGNYSSLNMLIYIISFLMKYAQL